MRNAQGRRSQISDENKFFWFLVRLRRGYEIYALMTLFNFECEESWLSKIFHTVSKIYAGIVRPKIKILSGDELASHTPPIFRDPAVDKHNADVTYFYIEHSRHLNFQRGTYCSNKKRNLLKVNAITTLSGYFEDVGPCLMGGLSDKQCWIKSGCTAKLDEVAKKARRTNQAFNQADSDENYSIATERISVEQSFSRIKQFRLLSGTIPMSILPHLNDYIIIAAYLSNEYRQEFRMM
eukprot:Pompholyxophrys_punicea_v1_NODE_548_length_1709_cov_25.765417.p1 type:complete len:237 gc:universal NODE_548_length_1709_cov_25.765417:765-55(-)